MEEWELIEGRAWAMSPAPLRFHQEISGFLYNALYNSLRGKPCKVNEAPFDVLLPSAESPTTSWTRSYCPISSSSATARRLAREGARGSPDLVVEILSPSTSKKYQREKFDMYERHGVREYWVVDPAGQWLCVYRLGPEGTYDSGELRERLRGCGPMGSSVLEGFVVLPEELAAEMDGAHDSLRIR
jgi:Uma2 family endonuclease